MPVIVVSGASNRNDTISFIKLGVFDFFEKPFRDDRFALAVADALRLRRIQTTMEELSSVSALSYMTFRKILHVIETEKLEASHHPAIQKYSQFLEEMGELIRRATFKE